MVDLSELKPGGGYSTPETAPRESYFSNARAWNVSGDLALCFSSVGQIMLANSWLVASPPTAGFLAFSGGLGLAGCMALTVIDLSTSDASSKQVHDISGSFTSPEGILFSTYGAITGDQKGFEDYAQIGALVADFRGLTFDFVPSPNVSTTAGREIFDKISFVADGYSLGHDVADYYKLSPQQSGEFAPANTLSPGGPEVTPGYIGQQEDNPNDAGWSADPAPICYSNPPGDPEYRNSGDDPSDPGSGYAPVTPSGPVTSPVYPEPEDPDY